MHVPEPPNANAATLELEHGPFKPDMATARSAHAALSSYLVALKSGAVPSPLSREAVEALPVPAEPSLDASGYWRLGAWLLEARSGNMALTHRPAQPEPRLEYVALLRAEARTLSVVSLSMRQIHPRR